jgi:hypothetical protein
MRTRNYLMIVMIVISGLVISSCKKTEDSGSPVGSNGSISLKVDGNTWNASLSVQAVNSGGVINVTGSDSNAKQAGITLIGANGTGTYKVGPNGIQGNMLRWTEGLASEQTYQATFIIGSGTIVVDKLNDSEISGSFEFEGYNTAQTSKTITEGTFNARF